MAPSHMTKWYPATDQAEASNWGYYPQFVYAGQSHQIQAATEQSYAYGKQFCASYAGPAGLNNATGYQGQTMDEMVEDTSLNPSHGLFA